MLDEFVLALTGSDRPKVCFVATAAGDAAEFINGFHERFGAVCETTHLSLFLPPFRDPAEVLLGQDVILVSGGSTSNMLAVWRLHGIDRLLRNAVDSGTILYGGSAGGLCWFEGGVTDSLGFDDVLRPMRDGLGFLAGTHCPHFDVPERRTAYATMVEDGRLGDGLGIDDHAAVHFVDGRVVQTVAALPDATAHRMTRSTDGTATITALPATTLPRRHP